MKNYSFIQKFLHDFVLNKKFINKSFYEIEKMIYSMADAGINIAKLRKSYLDDFIEVIGANKTAKLMRAEKEFGRRMMARMKGGKRPQDGGRKNGERPNR